MEGNLWEVHMMGDTYAMEMFRKDRNTFQKAVDAMIAKGKTADDLRAQFHKAIYFRHDTLNVWRFGGVEYEDEMGVLAAIELRLQQVFGE